jgi:hypothetical protein
MSVCRHRPTAGGGGRRGLLIATGRGSRIPGRWILVGLVLLVRRRCVRLRVFLRLGGCLCLPFVLILRVVVIRLEREVSASHGYWKLERGRFPRTGRKVVGAFLRLLRVGEGGLELAGTGSHVLWGRRTRVRVQCVLVKW